MLARATRPPRRAPARWSRSVAGRTARARSACHGPWPTATRRSGTPRSAVGRRAADGRGAIEDRAGTGSRLGSARARRPPSRARRWSVRSRRGRPRGPRRRRASVRPCRWPASAETSADDRPRSAGKSECRSRIRGSCALRCRSGPGSARRSAGRRRSSSGTELELEDAYGVRVLVGSSRRWWPRPRRVRGRYRPARALERVDVAGQKVAVLEVADAITSGRGVLRWLIPAVAGSSSRPRGFVHAGQW